MDIAQYISELLNEHKEVSLPGIGTFFKRKTSAHYNEVDGLFYPPSEKIDFKPEEGSDSILIQHIVSSKHISESSAAYFVERFCANLKDSLEKDSKVNITPLGVLLNKNGVYTLNEGSQQSGPDGFGLRPVKEREVVQVASDGIGKPLADESPLLAETHSSGNRGIFIVLAVLLGLATLTALAYYFYPQYFKNLNLPERNKPAKKAPVPVEKSLSVTDSLGFADTIMSNLEKEGIYGARVEKAPDSVNISTEAVTVDTVKVPAKPSTSYEVIVASFGLKREAETSVRSLRKAGIDATVIEDKSKPKYKVSIGSFPSMKAANKEKIRIQKEGVRKDAWILTLKNKN